MRDISGKRRALVALITFALAVGVAAQAVVIDSRTNARPDSGDVRGMEQPRAATANGLALAGTTTTPNDNCTLIECDEALAAAVDLETKMADSLQQGHVVEINFGSTQKVPGDVVGTGGWGDSGLWTGTYVAAQAMRYAVAKTNLANLRDKIRSSGKDNSDSAPGQELKFWKGQRDQALSRLKTILAAEHRDINIAEDWTGSLKIPPDVNTVDPINQRHAANFGGGIIKGERGMIMRSCTPVGLGAMGIEDTPGPDEQPVNDNYYRVFTITSTVDDVAYNCETAPSRDTYAGLTFGLLTAFDLVGPDEPALRKQIRDDLLSMGNFLVKYGWNYPRPHGYVSADHDFDGAISPLMVYVPMARLNMVQAVRHVLKDGGTEADRQKWDAVWAEELASQGPILAFSMEVDAADAGHSGYYKYNLHHLNAFNITRLENDPAVRTLFKQALGVMDRTTGDDINAHFETITWALTGEEGRLDAAAQHLREWRQYRARIDQGGETCNGLRDANGNCSDRIGCPQPLECVPQDQMEVSQSTPAGPRNAIIPGLSDIQSQFPGQPKPKVRSRYPLPVALRPPSDFLWQRPSTQLNGYVGASHRYPGVDYLLPYWMIRYYTEVEEPGSGSFPEWAGPAHV